MATRRCAASSLGSLVVVLVVVPHSSGGFGHCFVVELDWNKLRIVRVGRVSVVVPSLRG